jgi:hypothetical protein
MIPAPGGELAQVQAVRLAGQSAVPGQEAGRASRSGPVKAGWMGTRAVVVAVIGYLPVGLRPGGWASRGPSNDKATNVKAPCLSRHVTAPGETEAGAALGNTPPCRLGVRVAR